MVTGCKERGAVPAHAWISLLNESHSFDRQKWRCVIVELVVSIESAEVKLNSSRLSARLQSNVAAQKRTMMITNFHFHRRFEILTDICDWT